MLIKCRKCKVERRDIKICPVCNVPEGENFPDLKYLSKRDYIKSSTFWKKQDLSQFIKMIPKNTKGRKKEAVEIKKIFIIQLREKYKLSFLKIGKIMGYKDHTTAFHHYNK